MCVNLPCVNRKSKKLTEDNSQPQNKGGDQPNRVVVVEKKKKESDPSSPSASEKPQSVATPTLNKVAASPPPQTAGLQPQQQQQEQEKQQQQQQQQPQQPAGPESREDSEKKDTNNNITTATTATTTPTKNQQPTPAMADQLKSAATSASNTVSSGAQQASDTASSGAKQATSSDTASKVTSGTGTKDWDAMTEEQKKAAFDALPEDQKKGKTYYEWLLDGYQHQKENWMPWIEDQYLRWFTTDNKASYAAKDTLDKSKVTGIPQVDKLQDGVNNLAAGQVGQGGLLQPFGDMTSKEGINRAERGGKDDGGGYLGAIGNSASSMGSYVGGMFGGKKEEEEKK